MITTICCGARSGRVADVGSVVSAFAGALSSGASGTGVAVGSSTQNVLPSPRVLSKPMVPCMASTSFCVMARPMPVPSMPLSLAAPR